MSSRNLDASSRPALISGEDSPCREGAGADRGGVDIGDDVEGENIGAGGAWNAFRGVTVMFSLSSLSLTSLLSNL